MTLKDNLVLFFGYFFTQSRAASFYNKYSMLRHDGGDDGGSGDRVCVSVCVPKYPSSCVCICMYVQYSDRYNNICNKFMSS